MLRESTIFTACISIISSKLSDQGLIVPPKSLCAKEQPRMDFHLIQKEKYIILLFFHITETEISSAEMLASLHSYESEGDKKKDKTLLANSP